MSENFDGITVEGIALGTNGRFLTQFATKISNPSKTGLVTVARAAVRIGNDVAGLLITNISILIPQRKDMDEPCDIRYFFPQMLNNGKFYKTTYVVGAKSTELQEEIKRVIMTKLDWLCHQELIQSAEGETLSVHRGCQDARVLYASNRHLDVEAIFDAEVPAKTPLSNIHEQAQEVAK